MSPVLQTSAHSPRPHFARVLQETLGPGKLLLVGGVPNELAEECRGLGMDATAAASGSEASTLLSSSDGVAPVAAAVWFYPQTTGEDEAMVTELAALAEEVVLLPAAKVDGAKRRPQLVESFRRRGFVPDYDCDLTALDRGALRLVRAQANGASLVPAAETAMARLNTEMRSLERTLRTRMSELEAADRHIARLEEKLLKLKDYRRSIKQLKEEKQALRKSPERKLGQVLLAPYLLPKKLVRAARKRWPARESKSRRANSPNEYQRWWQGHQATPAELAEMRIRSREFSNAPLFSIITPVYNTPPAWLEEAVESVRAQAYENWELMLIDDGSTEEATRQTLARLAARDSRVRSLRLEERSGISAASNHGIAAAQGEWIGLLDHDDLLEPDALYQNVRLLQDYPEADLIYSDEDKLTEAGLDAPFLKPDWSPDFFLSYNYICHFTTMRRALVQELGGFRSEFDFAQDYDLYLRVTARSPQIFHIPRILYHWRRSAGSTSQNFRAKPEAFEAARGALTAHLRRHGQAGHVSIDWNTHVFHIRREITSEKEIAIIIATRDRVDLLDRCITSVEEKTGYERYQIVIVDNDSQTEEARHYLSQTRHRVLHFPGPFNYSAINNFAVAQTDAPWLLFLNNDVEAIERDWLSAMVEHVQRPEVGAVGARLIFRDETVQHAGIVLGVRGTAKHAFCGFPADAPGVCRQLQVTRNYSAVTAACLLTRREVFESVGGFDEEQLPVIFNDVDLCLKMRAAGYFIVYTPFAKLYHDESASRRQSVEPIELGVLRQRWPAEVERDPYYNPNLSRAQADFSLGEPVPALL